MKNKILMATFIGSLAVSTIASADDKSCGTILCLGGTMQGGDGGAACDQSIQDYFDIVKYKKKKRFDAGRTFQARAEYLDKCESENDGEKARIQAKYGTIQRNPGF